MWINFKQHVVLWITAIPLFFEGVVKRIGHTINISFDTTIEHVIAFIKKAATAFSNEFLTIKGVLFSLLLVLVVADIFKLGTLGFIGYIIALFKEISVVLITLGPAGIIGIATIVVALIISKKK